MKKTILILFTIVIIIVTIICVKYFSYQNEYAAILKENEEYEQYKEKEIYGIELATVINKAIDKNVKNDDENSIKIQIYMRDNEQTYEMETIYNAGMEQFIQYYGNIKFKCSKIEYNEKTKKVKYMLFEQNVTS